MPAPRAAPVHPSPCPSPLLPGKVAAAVLDVPFGQRLDFFLRVTTRYLAELLWVPAAAACRTLASPRIVPLTDEELGATWEEGSWSTHLCPTLDPADLAAFAPHMAAGAEGDRFFKVDYTAIGYNAPFDGIHTAATVTLVRRPAGTEKLVPLAIRLGDLVVEPGDGDAWQTAKLFVASGAPLLASQCFHARTHFPMDAIAALAQTILPRDHLLFRLLAPHLRFQLELDRQVLHTYPSVAHNHQIFPWCPFPGHFLDESGRGMAAVLSAGYAGIPGNSAYPAWRYPTGSREPPSAFGRQQRQYFDVLHAFTAEALADLPHDASIAAWADACAEWVPGFPNGAEIADRDRRAAAVGYFLYDVTVAHTADHWGFSLYPMDRYPLRLRVPPPSGREIPAISVSDAVTRRDMIRRRIAQKLYFGPPVTVTRLRDVEYGFTEPGPREAARRVHGALRETGRAWSSTPQIPFEEIAASIQF